MLGESATDKRSVMIARGDFSAVATHSELPYLYAVHSNIVSVYQRNGETFLKRCSFSLKWESPSICVCKDKLLVCLTNIGRIDIYSLDGVWQCSTGHSGKENPGSLNSPYISSDCSHGDMIWIADKDNNRIQTLQLSTLHWSVEKLTPSIEYPRSVVKSAGMLYVCEYGSQQLSGYFYSMIRPVNTAK